jgi:hypothetical protein
MRDALSHGALGLEALPFLESVVALVSHPLGGPVRRGDEEHERVVVDRVMRLLEASLGDDRAIAAAAETLAADRELLAAFFQSLDQLPGPGYPPADSIALLVAAAVGRL